MFLRVLTSSLVVYSRGMLKFLFLIAQGLGGCRVLLTCHELKNQARYLLDGILYFPSIHLR